MEYIKEYKENVERTIIKIEELYDVLTLRFYLTLLMEVGYNVEVKDGICKKAEFNSEINAYNKGTLKKYSVVEKEYFEKYSGEKMNPINRFETIWRYSKKGLFENFKESMWRMRNNGIIIFKCLRDLYGQDVLKTK